MTDKNTDATNSGAEKPDTKEFVLSDTGSLTFKFTDSVSTGKRQRLDLTILDALQAHTDKLPEGLPSRTRLQSLIATGAVEINGTVITDPGASVKGTDVCKLANLSKSLTYDEQSPKPENIPLDILFEDEDLIVLNKPAGLVTHPAPGHSSGTLVHALLHHCGTSLSRIGGAIRPGIVHRLDKETSGLMVVAKTDFAHRTLSSSFASHANDIIQANVQGCSEHEFEEQETNVSSKRISRSYLALVRGHPHPIQGEINAPISRAKINRKKVAISPTGRPAITFYRTLLRWGNPDRQLRQREDCSLLLCELKTGRTHQIRVHMASIGHSVIGDPLYGGRHPAHRFSRQALHATHLILNHPRSDKRLHFTAPPPEDFKSLLKSLGSPHGETSRKLDALMLGTYDHWSI